MVKIIWDIELDDGEELNPNELIGAIDIVAEGTKISDGLVYLDDWFDCLIDGFNALQEGLTEFESDLLSEPDPLIFQLKNNMKIEIIYQKQIITGFTLDELKYAIIESGIKLIARVKKETENKDLVALKKIIEFSKNGK